MLYNSMILFGLYLLFCAVKVNIFNFSSLRMLTFTNKPGNHPVKNAQTSV